MKKLTFDEKLEIRKAILNGVTLMIDKDRLEAAVMKYVESFSLDDLRERVSDDLYQYYRKSATDEEITTFIPEVEEA